MIGAPLSTTPEPCKHCADRIAITPNSSRSYVHVEGHQAGKHTCAIEPYGFHAEPIGTPCSDHPANPCNGSRGFTCDFEAASFKVVLMPRQHGRPQTEVTKAIGKLASLITPPSSEPIDHQGRGA